MSNTESLIEMRSLSFVVAYLSLTYYFSLAWLSTYLPQDSWYILICTTGYALYGIAMSAIGVFGAARKCPDLMAIFSHHLYFETFLSTVPKFGILYFFHDLTRNLCDPSRVLPSVNSMKGAPGCTSQTTRCLSMVALAHTVLIAVLFALTFGQWSMAGICRRYGLELEAETSDAPKDVEKGPLLAASDRDEDERPDEELNEKPSA